MCKVTIIEGPQGSGKSRLATTMVDYPCVVLHAYQLGSELGLSSVTKDTKTVIVEEFIPDDKNMEEVKKLVSSDKLAINKRGKSVELIDTPNFIFVCQSPVPLPLREDNRRFTLITL